MTSKADKLPLETELVARDNNTILTLKPGDQTLSRLTQLIIVVCSFQYMIIHFVSLRSVSQNRVSRFKAEIRIKEVKINSAKHTVIG